MIKAGVIVHYHKTPESCNSGATRILDLALLEVLSGRMTDPFLRAAIDEAKQGLAEGGIPIGAVIVHQGQIIGRGHNMRVQKGDPLLHGEMSAFQQAGRAGRLRFIASAFFTRRSRHVRCVVERLCSIKFRI